MTYGLAHVIDIDGYASSNEVKDYAKISVLALFDIGTSGRLDLRDTMTGSIEHRAHLLCRSRPVGQASVALSARKTRSTRYTSCLEASTTAAGPTAQSLRCVLVFLFELSWLFRRLHASGAFRRLVVTVQPRASLQVQ